MNLFFSSIVPYHKIPEYSGNNASSENIADPVIKIILKYRNHQSILSVGEEYKERSTSPLRFSEVCKEEILRDILNFDTSKTWQDTDAPSRVTKENPDIFAEFLDSSFN